MALSDIKQLISGGESETVEFKKSTGQLKRAAETLCAFLNASGGKVIIGVTSGGKLVGQEVSDRTLQAIADTLGRLEPPPPIKIERIPLTEERRRKNYCPLFKLS